MKKFFKCVKVFLYSLRILPVNMIIELPYHFREKFKYDILASNYASEILTLKNISHIKIEKKSQLIDFMKNKDYENFNRNFRK